MSKSESKSESDLRRNSIKIRVTADELAKLHSLKVGGELATWMRETCLGVAPKRRKVADASPELLRALAQIGNNLNQIAKRVNTLSPLEAVSAVVELERIANALENLRDSHAG